MKNRYDEIVDFCKSISEMANPGPSGVKIPKKSFESEGFKISLLSYEELRAACVGLSYTLLYQGMNMVIDKDQIVLWDRIGKILLEPPSMYFHEISNAPLSETDSSFRELFVTTVKLSTGEWSLYQKRPISKWQWFQMPNGYPAHAAVNPAIYFVYPLLEAVLKRTLSNFIGPDGTVKSQFTVSSGRKYKAGKFCSRVDHMIELMGQQNKLSDLNYDLQQIFNKIATLYQGSEPIKVISQKWRNPAIHGEDNIPTAYGILLNMIMLISMDYVKSKIRDRLN